MCKNKLHLKVSIFVIKIQKKLAYVMDLKNVRRERIKEYADKFGATYTPIDQSADFNPLWNH